MLFYQHAGYETGSADWPIQAVKIGNGWDFRQVFAGNEGAIYAITYDGDMLFYQHAGYEDGSAAWPIQAVKIGNGWNFRQVFRRQRAVYAITEDGDMFFYLHAGFRDSSADWPLQGVRIGTVGTLVKSSRGVVNDDPTPSRGPEPLHARLPLTGSTWATNAVMPAVRSFLARFGRHPHRNETLGQSSTPEETVHAATGEFVHHRRPPLVGA